MRISGRVYNNRLPVPGPLLPSRGLSSGDVCANCEAPRFERPGLLRSHPPPPPVLHTLACFAHNRRCLFFSLLFSLALSSPSCLSLFLPFVYTSLVCYTGYRPLRVFSFRFSPRTGLFLFDISSFSAEQGEIRERSHVGRGATWRAEFKLLLRDNNGATREPTEMITRRIRGEH